MATKKITKKEMFEALLNKYDLTESEVAFIEHEIELLDKKNGSRKPTADQLKNEETKVEILNLMENGKPYTVTEIQKMVGLESNQKTSALIRQLKESGLVIRTEEKGKAYFTKA